MLNGLFSFRGRLGRLGYLGVGAVQIVFLIVGFSVLAMTPVKSGMSIVGLTAILLASFALAWVGMAAMVKRIRDMGWNVVLGVLGALFLPFVGMMLFVWPGKPADGPDPSVFSDEPEPRAPKAGKAAKTPASTTPDWMQRALNQASAAPAPSPAQQAAPARFSGGFGSASPMAGADGSRSQFGLRR